MKKQLLALTLLTLGYAATTDCKDKNRYTYTTVQPRGTAIMYSKKQPMVPTGVTATRIKKHKWRITNNSGQAVQIQRRKK